MILCPMPERTYRITQRFGDRPEYYSQFGHLGHNGVFDLAPRIMGLPAHMKCYAPHDGYCSVFHDNLGYGHFVRIKSLPYNYTGDRRQSELAHLSKILVSDGQWVGAGDLIGILGNTGNSSGIHLHWAYKLLNSQGKQQNTNNGYSGALDVSKFTLRWLNKTLI